ncbi:MAG: DUF563 domain-containing protein [Proteobacteria bacterium]|nr:DUF563 domain-containing protein [Pseudomonadota bacterium]
MNALPRPFLRHGASAWHVVVPAGQEAVAAAARAADAGRAVPLLPAAQWAAWLAAHRDPLPWAGIVATWPSAADAARDTDAWRLQRELFDRGYVAIGAADAAQGPAQCFLASDHVRTLHGPGRIARARVTMATFADHGRFANQMFRYAFARLYGLRHGVAVQLPRWDGNVPYALDDDVAPAPPTLPALEFPGFTDDDLALWHLDEPPVNVDFVGYFQETPACWRPHRPLLRTLFALAQPHAQALDAWRDRVTEGGRRTLVAVHVRRGDYRDHPLGSSYFRLVPEAWYVQWLHSTWSTLERPLLYVATDEPDSVLPAFAAFERAPPPATALPAHVADFEIMRRADRLAVCNSSFSHMAALLAPDAQRCVIPSMTDRRFEPYEPWIDPGFWKRFGPSTATAVLFDVTDLVQYLLHHATLTGIQRVQGGILAQLVALSHAPPVHLVVFDEAGRIGVLPTDAVLALLDATASRSTSRAARVAAMRALLRSPPSQALRAGDLFLTLGAYWAVPGTGRALQALRRAGVVIGALVHDVLPIDTPEFFDAHTAQVSARGLAEMLAYADFLLTTTEFNRLSLAQVMEERGFDRLPVRVVPLARELAAEAAPDGAVRERVRALAASRYVLCVGTLEVRKNPQYLFHLWKMLVASGRNDVPRLVYAGRNGWLVRDFMDQLAASNNLDGCIEVIHDASDVELDYLYRHCLCTMFPSLAEGWGLPVSESLAHGKVCLCANVGGIPEAGGAAADYIDPYNVRDGYARLVHYLDDPDALQRREQEIAAQFQPRSWHDVATDVVRAAQSMAAALPVPARPRALRLPAGRFVRIGRDAAPVPADPLDGTLSAALVCETGWDPPDAHGVAAAAPEARLRFRVDVPTPSVVALVLRVAARSRAVALRMRAGAGPAISVTVAANSERDAALSTAVGADGIVDVTLEEDTSVAASTWRDALAGGRARWAVTGLLYFEPARVAAPADAVADAGKPNPRARMHAAPVPMVLRAVTTPDSRRVDTFDAFVAGHDCFWATESTLALPPPLCVDAADRRRFEGATATTGESASDRRDHVRFLRRSNVLVSMARFSEGSIFDRSGVWRGMGFLGGAPRGSAPWLDGDASAIRIDADAIARAPEYDGSWLVYFNGNLHNYYHWAVEALLGLDVLGDALGERLDVRVPMPQSVDVDAAFDHRSSLALVGVDRYPVVEIVPDLIRVREAIWFDPDLVQSLPAHHLRRFRGHVAARNPVPAAAACRRLYVARKGAARTVANHAAVEALLVAEGFETVYLEGMPIREQIALFQQAEFVVGPHGAGLANLLFCPPGTRVIEFMPTAEFRSFFWIIAAKLDLVHGVLFCPTPAGTGFQGALDVDVDRLHMLLRKAAAAR